MQVIIDSILVNYNDKGSGKIILLIHGWGDNLSTFDAISPILSKTYNVISLDLPGFGLSGAPENSWSLQDYAVFLQKFLKKINKLNIYGVIGHSNGGAVLLKGISLKLLRPERLVLIASSGVRNRKKRKKIALLILAKIFHFPLMLLPKNTRIKLKKYLYKKIGSDLFVAENMQETFKKIVNEDITNQISNISTKSMLIYGANDKITPPEIGKKLASKLQNSEFVAINAAGHFLHQENLQDITTIIEGFLNVK